jgi:hypothetical protein
MLRLVDKKLNVVFKIHQSGNSTELKKIQELGKKKVKFSSRIKLEEKTEKKSKTKNWIPRTFKKK